MRATLGAVIARGALKRLYYNRRLLLPAGGAVTRQSLPFCLGEIRGGTFARGDERWRGQPGGGSRASDFGGTTQVLP
ncbi:hypothetical protein [Kibdelosporangium phytohabitans]|uniref:hypothetical protein n=1 Tax=Kibdelosporangium phytohabitans TaxID=860235 RepID=UPI0012F96CF1|nr:hypothetical protein [Kibdelosporangium phytohabitans]MBE1467305.1 hypothetical protein [Kibdelosporangium phytohabitans]